jgi:hypothetical protein
MLGYEMNFYWWREGEIIKVQNAIGGHLGQLHEHSPEDFEKWQKDSKIDQKNLKHLKECDRN